MKKHTVSLSQRQGNEAVLSDQEQSELLNYRSQKAKTPEEIESDISKIELEISDKRMARVSEDIIDLLLNKGLITDTELPAETLELIMLRKALRNKLI